MRTCPRKADLMTLGGLRAGGAARAGAVLLAVFAALSTAAAAEPVAPASARFAEPTNRYPHNVLGDLPGYGALEVTLERGTVLRLVLPPARVFEDIAPRLWDIDGDGIAEVVAVESDQRQGARLTAWTVQGAADGTHSLSMRAASDFIGTRFRWLAPAGIADFSGDGRPEIALVEMPHLARRLVLVRLEGDRLSPIARLEGFSNHRIGENFITGGVRDCGAGPEALLPTGDWRRVARVRLHEGRLEWIDHGPFVSTGAIEAQLRCVD
jgi:hypothetical protein